MNYYDSKRPLDGRLVRWDTEMTELVRKDLLVITISLICLKICCCFWSDGELRCLYYY